MSTMIGFQSGAVTPPAVVPEPSAPAGLANKTPRISPPIESAEAAAQEPPPEPPSREEIESVVSELRDAMAHLPGGAREVALLFEPEDQSFLVEIRNKETGAVLQTFPPENLLNLRNRSADLLGVLIDRHI